MLDNKVIIDLDDYVDDIDVDLSDVVIASSTPIQLQSKNVNPTTSTQTITADGGYDGLSSVTINAVTSAIDNNIQAGNIKKDVTILGVTGTLVAGGVDIVSTSNLIPLLNSTNVTSFTNGTVGGYSGGALNNSFRGCVDFLYLDVSFDSLNFANDNFNGCVKLKYLIFRSVTVHSLNSLSNFTNAGTQNDNPSNVIYIYVPSSLISSYRTATNWSTLYNNGKVEFVAIS